jgi:hypothetical protein
MYHLGLRHPARLHGIGKVPAVARCAIFSKPVQAHHSSKEVRVHCRNSVKRVLASSARLPSQQAKICQVNLPAKQNLQRQMRLLRGHPSSFPGQRSTRARTASLRPHLRWQQRRQSTSPHKPLRLAQQHRQHVWKNPNSSAVAVHDHLTRQNHWKGNHSPRNFVRCSVGAGPSSHVPVLSQHHHPNGVVVVFRDQALHINIVLLACRLTQQ